MPTDEVILLTGATSGIGLETARRLASRAKTLVLQGPEPADAVAPVIASIRSSGAARVEYVSADFTSLADAAAGASAMAEAAREPITALINDAGVPGSPERRTTADGHERTLQVNFLALVLLSERLAPSVAPGGRLVNLASATHESASLDLDDIELEHGYSPVRAYARSKLAIVMYTLWQARRHADGPTAVSLQPGVINTALLGAMFGRIGTGVDVGARSILEALDAPARGGEYYDEGRLTAPSARARNVALGDALMDWTLAALGQHLL